MTSLLGQTQAIGQNAYGTYNQLAGSLGGHPDLVHFVDPKTGATLLQFDCVINETHSREAQPTNFPIESGSSISDHIFVSPVELAVQGIISDTPIGTKDALITEGVATALSLIEPPLGVAAAGIGYAAYNATKKTASPSIAAFNKILAIQAGNQYSNPPIPPKAFDVKTKLRLYRSMVIRSLTVPRDATISNALVFQMTLAQLTVVQTQSILTQNLSNAAMQAAKANEGEQEGKNRNGALDGYNKSQKDLSFLRPST